MAVIPYYVGGAEPSPNGIPQMQNGPDQASPPVLSTAEATDEVTQALESAMDRDGLTFEQLKKSIADDLLRLAGKLLSDERWSVSLAPETLAFLGWLRLERYFAVKVPDTQHLIRLVVRAMRRILCERGRKAKLRREREGAQLPVVGAAVQSQSPDPTLAIDVEDARQWLHEKYPDAALAFSLHHEMVLPRKEVAALTGVTAGVVDLQLRLARTLLQQRLQSYR